MSFTPFPPGTVRGPYRSNGSVHYMVQTPTGWVPFNRTEQWPGQREAEVSKLAKDYAAEVIAGIQNEKNGHLQDC